jgi:signal transduction histidine kinase/TolB-like protein
VKLFAIRGNAGHYSVAGKILPRWQTHDQYRQGSGAVTRLPVHGTGALQLEEVPFQYRNKLSLGLSEMNAESRLVAGQGSVLMMADGEPVARSHQRSDQTQEPLYQANKMESLVRLTGGVAHEFNNILGVVLGAATALRLDAEARRDVKAIRRAKMIERSAERGGRLADQLLAFARNQILRPQSISAYDALSEIHELLAQAAGETVQVRLLADQDLWNCSVDPGQLDSAILNLVLNSRDAMPDGGNITLSCHNRTVTAEQLRNSTSSPGDYVRIDVKDSGTGIAADLLPHVFEPFFTSKPIGKGSGLGLAQVHGFAEQSGGWVALESQLGRGTTVSIYLPRQPEVEPPALVQDLAREAKATVLVVEPETELRTTICETLAQSEYRVLAATSASGAMAYLVSDEPIQVILAESHLPGGVNGISLLRDACRIRPGIHALLTCRASDAEAEGNGPKDEGLEVLTKPYQPSDLVHLIGALLKSATFSAETEEMLAEVRDIGAPGPSLATLNLSADKAAGTYEARRTAIRLGVMPFKTIKTTGDDTSFSLGLAEEITGAFARFRWLTCVSSASVATIYSEPSQTSAWQELDLDFLVTGTLRTEANRISIQARLLNMRGSGELIWSRGFDSSLLDVLNLQERIAAETVAQIAPEVLVWEAETALLRPQINPSAYELMLRAIPAIYRLDQETFRAAGALLASSLKADPASAACHSWLAHWYLLLIGQGWAEDVADASHLAGQLAQQAITLDPGDARGFTVAGHIEAFLHRKPEDALGLHERAIALNPNLALAWCYSGLAHCYLGQHTDAVRHVERARRLSPHDPHGFFFDMALAVPFYLSGDYEIAAQLGRRARNAHPGFSSTYKGLLASLGRLGLAGEAAPLRERLLELEPQFSVRDAVARSPLQLEEDLERYADGLRLAGIPEGTQLSINLSPSTY